MNRPAGRALPRPPNRVNKREVYEYALKCVLVASKPVSTQLSTSAPVGSSSSIPAVTSNVIRNSVKISKDFLKPLQKRLSNLSPNTELRVLGLHSQDVLRLLSVFGGVTMNDKKFKDRMKNGTMADLLAYFLEFIVVSGVSKPGMLLVCRN